MNRYYGTFPVSSPLRSQYVLVIAKDYETAVRIMNTQFNQTWQTLFPQPAWEGHKDSMEKGYYHRMAYLREEDFPVLFSTGRIVTGLNNRR